MGGNVADYTILSDGPFAVKAGGSSDKVLNMSLPGKTLRGHRAILNYKIQSAEGLRLEVEVNNTVVHRGRVANSRLGFSFHEVISPNVLKPNAANTMRFTATNGKGTLSDVVLWFQRRT